MLLFLDIETTGLDSKKDDILELAAVRWCGRSVLQYASKNEFETLLRIPEGREIPSFITSLTGITSKMCETEGISIEQAQEEWKNFLLPDDIIVGHNIGFDTGFLREKGFFLPNIEIDTFILSSLLLRHEESHSLEVLTEKYDLVHENAHRAKSDVLANIEFWKLLSTYWANTSLSQKTKDQMETIIERSSFPEKLFFALPHKNFTEMEEVLHKIEKHTLPLISPKDSYQKELEEFLSSPSEKSIVFWDTVEKNILPPHFLSFFLSKNLQVCIAYPDKEIPSAKELFYTLKKEIPETSFFLPEGRNIQEEKVNTLWEKPLFSPPESIVALKTLFAKGEDDMESLSFRREEWSVIRTLTHPTLPKILEGKGVSLVPFSYLKYVPQNTIVIFTHGESLEEDISETFQIQHFSKRILEDIEKYNSPDFRDAFTAWSTTFGTALREKLGENEYPIKTKWDEKFIMSHEELRKRAKEFDDLTENFQDCFTEPPLLDLKTFFNSEDDSNMIKMIQLFPDNAWAIIMTPIDLSEYFSEMTKGNSKFLFLGNGYPKNKKGDLLFPFLPEGVSIKTFPKPKDYILKNTVYIQDLSKEEKIYHLVKDLFSRHEEVLFSVNSKKAAKDIEEKLTNFAKEEDITIISSEKGSAGKIRSFLGKKGKKLCIAPPKILDEIHAEEFGFTALILLKFAFDPPKDPLLTLRKKGIENEFEDFAVPRARAKFEREIYRLYQPNKSIEIIFGDLRLGEKNSFGAKFGEVLGEGIKISPL